VRRRVRTSASTASSRRRFASGPTSVSGRDRPDAQRRRTSTKRFASALRLPRVRRIASLRCTPGPCSGISRARTPRPCVRVGVREDEHGACRRVRATRAAAVRRRAADLAPDGTDPVSVALRITRDRADDGSPAPALRSPRSARRRKTRVFEGPGEREAPRAPLRGLQDHRAPAASAGAILRAGATPGSSPVKRRPGRSARASRKGGSRASALDHAAVDAPRLVAFQSR